MSHEVVRAGGVVYLDYMVGDHGNDHGDFKITGKPSLEGGLVEP